MKSFIVLFLFWLTISQASITEPFRAEIGCGYREDSFVLKVLSDTSQERLELKEQMKHARYFASTICANVIQRDIYVLANFEYYYLLSREMKIVDLYDFKMKVNGYDLESKGELGYAVDLTEGRFVKVLIIPLFGYVGVFKIFKPDSKQSAEKQKQICYGPYVGVKMRILKDRCSFDMGYDFRWLNFLERASFFNGIDTKKIHDTVHGGYSHFAEIESSLQLTKIWEAKLKIFYDYFMCDKKDINLKNNESKNRSKFYERWWNLAFVIELVMRF